ncbi:NUDIX hydrolase [Candidatus Neomarinimicrobiota bacterium]
MSKQVSQQWLAWAREIQSLCQTGLAHSLSDYDTVRYKRLAEIAAEIASQNSTLLQEDLIENFLVHPGYATPKVDVRSAVLKNGDLLLVQEKQDQRWSLPGGWADVGDRPSEVAVREVHEECGLIVKPIKVLGIYDANRIGRSLEFYHAYKIVFLCEYLGGTPQPSDETLAAGFFDVDQLPALSHYRTNDRHITDIKKHIYDSGRPADFD